MFKRPHSTKTLAPLRSSDLRKLRDALLSSFPSPLSPLSKDLLKALLPDGTLTAKATTHLDEPLTLYFAPPSSSGGAEPDCRLLRLGKGADGPLVPTCYLLDLVPELLPRLETARAVVENLVSGSALFVSGVSPRSLYALPASSKEGDLVAITVASDGGQTVVAVGTLGADKETLLKLQKEDGGTGKGKAVVTLHARGDFLWQSGSQLDASPLVPLSSSSGSSARASSPSPPPVPPAPKSEPVGTAAVTAALASTSLADDADASTPAPAAPAAELTPSEVDSILLRALLLSIQTTLSASSSLFPMSASTLYSSHILPLRPSLRVNPLSSTAEVKKSSWKKLDKFVKEVSAPPGGKKSSKWAGLVQAKEVRGEWVVMGVNACHPEVEALRPYRTLAQDASSSSSSSSATPSSSAGGAPSASSTSTSNAAATTDSAPGAGEIEITEYFKPSSEAVRELLDKVPHERPHNGLYTAPLLTSLIRTFSTTLFSLAHPRSPSLLLLSPLAHPSPSSLSLEQESAMELLAAIVCDPKKGESAESYGEREGRRGCVGREVVGGRVREGCVKHWGVRRKGEEGEVVKKGSPPVIKVQIKNVGKRQVTLVSGHEPYSLFTSDEFAEELKKKSASSTSVQPLAGSAKKGQTPKVEIMCQGTHDALVVKLLTTKYSVPRRVIEVDLSKSKK
ncbi:hypothetical protein JCM6882_008562 [Rhodosporidiobolus microsporus]